MLVISKLQPRNSESKWVGGCYVKSKMEYIYMPSRVYSIGVDLINFLNYMGGAYAQYPWLVVRGH